MNQQEIDEVSEALRKQGLTWNQTNFAVALVRNMQDKEREACAKVCEGTMDEAVLGGNDDYNTGREMGAAVCANRIRMRSNV